MNQKAYEGLSSEYKAIVECAAAFAHTDRQAKYDSRNMPALKTLISQGVKLHAFPKDVLNASCKAANEVSSELNDTNPGWKKIYTDYAAFRKESNLWFSLAEASMDDFMQAQRL